MYGQPTPYVTGMHTRLKNIEGKQLRLIFAFGVQLAPVATGQTLTQWHVSRYS